MVSITRFLKSKFMQPRDWPHHAPSVKKIPGTRPVPEFFFFENGYPMLDFSPSNSVPPRKRRDLNTNYCPDCSMPIHYSFLSPHNTKLYNHIEVTPSSSLNGAQTINTQMYT
jgi:hypothetical protein